MTRFKLLETLTQLCIFYCFPLISHLTFSPFSAHFLLHVHTGFNFQTGMYEQWLTQKLFMGWGFIQRHRVVICILCALFVTSQNDVIVLFPNQRFGEICWHNMHILLYIHSSYFMCQCTEYKLLELQVKLSEENACTQRYDTAVRNCKKYEAAR